jgi:DNA segregation ATPase FtsK/SpoIIIE, S-DNA-T family
MSVPGRVTGRVEFEQSEYGCISRTLIGLERAGHVAAVITILADEAHLVARMQDALSGQLNRRQEMLRAAGNFANIAD